MPMPRGQRVRPCISGDAAATAITRLADRNPTLAEVITYLGQRILDLPGVCLREDGHRTYDLAFVRPRSPQRAGSRSKAFVGFNSPTFEGEEWWIPTGPEPNRLRVGVRVNGDALFEDRLIERRGFRQEQQSGVWHDVLIGRAVGIPAGTETRELTEVFEVIERAYNSFG